MLSVWIADCVMYVKYVTDSVSFSESVRKPLLNVHMFLLIIGLKIHSSGASSFAHIPLLFVFI